MSDNVTNTTSNVVDAANAASAATEVLEPTFYAILIGSAAFVAAIVCFVLFVRASSKNDPSTAVTEAQKKGAFTDIDPNVLASFAKALADAFSKAGPSVVTLIGSLLLLLLAGEAWQVWHVVGSSVAAPVKPEATANRTGSDAADNSAADANAQLTENGSTITVAKQ